MQLEPQFAFARPEVRSFNGFSAIRGALHYYGFIYYLRKQPPASIISSAQFFFRKISSSFPSPFGSLRFTLPAPKTYLRQFLIMGLSFSFIFFPLEPFAKFSWEHFKPLSKNWLLFSYSTFFPGCSLRILFHPFTQGHRTGCTGSLLSPSERTTYPLYSLPQTHSPRLQCTRVIHFASPYLAFGARTRRVLKTGVEYGALPGGLNCRSYYLLDPSRLTWNKLTLAPLFRTHSRLIRLHCRYTETKGLLIRLLCQERRRKTKRMIEKAVGKAD